MNNDERDKILAEYGVIVACESPFEIETDGEGRASGDCALFIVNAIMKEHKRKIKDSEKWFL